MGWLSRCEVVRYAFYMKVMTQITCMPSGGIPAPALPVFYDPVRLHKRVAKYHFRAHPFYKFEFGFNSLLVLTLLFAENAHTVASGRWACRKGRER